MYRQDVYNFNGIKVVQVKEQEKSSCVGCIFYGSSGCSASDYDPTDICIEDSTIFAKYEENKEPPKIRTNQQIQTFNGIKVVAVKEKATSSCFGCFFYDEFPQDGKNECAVDDYDMSQCFDNSTIFEKYEEPSTPQEPNQINTTIGNDGKEWPNTFDGEAWATEFCNRNPAIDKSVMISWFANAIMIGYDTAKWEFEKNSMK